MNIKIVICFIMLMIFVPASSGAAEKVWSAKYSALLKANESAAFENYVLKARAINNDTSSISIYRDGIELEKKDFAINEIKKYDSFGLSLLGIYGDYSWIAFSRLEDKDIWIPTGELMLKWGEKSTFEDISMEIESIGKDSVNMSLSRNNVTGTYVLKNNSSMNYDILRIWVAEINSTGLINIQFFKYNETTFDAEIISEKDEYYPDESINFSINITGNHILNAASVYLESDSPVQIKPVAFASANISGTRTFRSRIDHLRPNSTIRINAEINVRDYRNNTYTASVSKEVSVLPNISISKHVPPETDDEKIPVELYLYNSGLKSIFLYIQDNVTEEVDGEQMKWNIEVGPKKSANVSYFISPQKPGIYKLGEALAKWDGEMSNSKKVNITVHMPYINLIKTAYDNRSNTDVELEIRNVGDRPAIVTVSDKIPDNYPLINGVPIWSGYLDAGKNVKLAYTVKGNAASLPSAAASYRDIRGTVRNAESNPVIKKLPAAAGTGALPVSTGRYEMIEFMIVSFLVISGIIGGIAFAAYVVTKKRMGIK